MDNKVIRNFFVSGKIKYLGVGWDNSVSGMCQLYEGLLQPLLRRGVVPTSLQYLSLGRAAVKKVIGA